MSSKMIVLPFGLILFLGLLSLFSVQQAAGSAWRETDAPGGTVPPLTSTLHLPVIYQGLDGAAAAGAQLNAVPIHANLPHCPHGAPPDVDLAVRSWAPYRGYLGLVGYGGETDPRCAPNRRRVCCPTGAGHGGGEPRVRLELELQPALRLPGRPDYLALRRLPYYLATTPGEESASPRADIFQGVIALPVLYAARPSASPWPTARRQHGVRLRRAHGRRGRSPRAGGLYRELDAAGRRELPGLRNGEVLGVAAGEAIKVAVRDQGCSWTRAGAKIGGATSRRSARCSSRARRPALGRPG